MKRQGSPSCWRWRCRCSQSLLKENESEEGNGSKGCVGEHENSPGPFIETMVEEWDEVGRKRTTMTKRDGNEGDQEGNAVEGGRGG